MKFAQFARSAKTQIGAFVKDETGATAIEYGLIVGLISIVIAATVPTIGTTLRGVFENINTTLSTATAKS